MLWILLRCRCLLYPSTFDLGNYDAMTPLVDILMKLFRNMVNVKMPFHLTLLSVCFCNLKALNTAKKGPMDFYLTSSLSTTSHSGKRSFVSPPLLRRCGEACNAHLYLVPLGDSLRCYCLNGSLVCSSYHRTAAGLKYIVIQEESVTITIKGTSSMLLLFRKC